MSRPMCLPKVWTYFESCITRKWLAGTVLIAEGLLVLILARRWDGIYRFYIESLVATVWKLLPRLATWPGSSIWDSPPFIGPVWSCPSTKAAIPEFRTLIAELEAWRNCQFRNVIGTRFTLDCTGFFDPRLPKHCYLHSRSRTITRIKWKTFSPKRRYV